MKLISDISCDLSSFTNEQMNILEKVYTTFKNDSPTSISEKSHDEPAWINNKELHSSIDFKYAFSLKNI